ncbi:MAG: TIGR00282 family metallophosphoesterase [Firmicutes bacterium]|nr:TIGR00282 family metallophosphoesterase [Bacillota bacterium]
MRVLMIGDVVGSPGRKALKDNVSGLKREFGLDLVMANGENAAGGMGITRNVAEEIFSYGIDFITMGNHVWNKKETAHYIEREERIIRPANYPAGVPGRGYKVVPVKKGINVAIANLSGRVFMDSLDCPFQVADQLLQEISSQARIIIFDFHAEATSEKIALGWYLNGRVSAVCGTHTHVQTADEYIMSGGTAYITDIGMTGAKESIIGFKVDPILERFTTQMPRKFEVAGGLYQLNAVIIDFDDDTGEAVDIQRIQNYQ